MDLLRDFLLFLTASALCEAVTVVRERGAHIEVAVDAKGDASLLSSNSFREALSATSSVTNANKFVESLASKAVKSYTPTEAESAALDTIREYIDRTFIEIEKAHEEDQLTVSRAEASIDGCGSDIEPVLERAANMSAVAQAARLNHRNCRIDEAVAFDERTAACKAYDDYRKSISNIDCVKSYFLKEMIGSDDEQIKTEWEQCLEKSWASLDAVRSHYLACKSSKQRVAAAQKDCNTNQAGFEKSVCDHAHTMDDACDTQVKCRQRAITDRTTVHAAVQVAEEGRKADYASGLKTKCFFAVFEASDADKPGKFQSCLDMDVGPSVTSGLDITYHEIPPEKPCTKVTNRPCGADWTDSEYKKESWFGTASMDTCKPCDPVALHAGYELSASFTKACVKSETRAAKGRDEIHCKVNEFSCGGGTHGSDDNMCFVHENGKLVRACFVDRCWSANAWQCSEWAKPGETSSHSLYGEVSCSLHRIYRVKASFANACTKSGDFDVKAGGEIHCKVNEFSCGGGTHASDDNMCQLNDEGTLVRACFVDRCWSANAWKCTDWAKPGETASHSFYGDVSCSLL